MPFCVNVNGDGTSGNICAIYNSTIKKDVVFIFIQNLTYMMLLCEAAYVNL